MNLNFSLTMALRHGEFWISFSVFRAKSRDSVHLFLESRFSFESGKYSHGSTCDNKMVRVNLCS